MKIYIVIVVFLSTIGTIGAQSIISNTQLKKLTEKYIYLHQNPELSFLEVETAAYLAKEMRMYGFTVTENIGGTGLVCILENGPGKTAMIRTDIDALPILEETGLPYASNKIKLDINGEEFPAMHACGHDIHMTVWLGSAEFLANNKDKWKGKLIFIAQPAEERAGGAKAMLADGLYQRFGTPDFALALHVNASLPAGMVGVCPEYSMANVDMCNITVYGKGGHGAYPHTTIDPIALSAKMIMDFQTIVSREINPLEPAVITVGSIHGGTKGNVIPNEVQLKLTMRSYSDEVRDYIRKRLKEKVESIARDAGLSGDRMPKYELLNETTSSVYNDPELTAKLEKYFIEKIGRENVKRTSPVMGGEDFSEYGRTNHKVPISLFWLGAVDRNIYAKSIEDGLALPSLHSSKFAPEAQMTITTGVNSMAYTIVNLLK